jgi:elongation factor G
VDIDHGTTVTDFLKLEREKGITIQSAAIPLQWPPPDAAQDGSAPARPPHTIHLIDTPGHLDFRFEVDRCLPILDGAVCILDGVEGVEAHTERVWATAQEHSLPRIVFVNKLDRDGANFHRSVKEIGSRLGAWPLVVQLPWWQRDKVVGVIDLVDEVAYRWKSPDDMHRYDRETFREMLRGDPDGLLTEMRRARKALVEGLADHDEGIADRLIEDDEAAITAEDLKQAIRRAIRVGDGKVAPVFAGASKVGIGVPQLMDAVLDYLPNPSERPEVKVQLASGKEEGMETLLGAVAAKKRPKGSGNVESVGTVFKVWKHPKEGILCFVRIYHGAMSRNSPLWNTRLGEFERPMGLGHMFADEFHSVEHLPMGHIGALRGLKQAVTGDTIMTMQPAQKHPAQPLDQIKIRPPEIPPPITTLVIDTYGHTVAARVEEELDHVSREDPSVQWKRDEGQSDRFIVQGMGGLHLLIIRTTLRERLGDVVDKITLGEVETELRESVMAPTGAHRASFDKVLVGKQGKATCIASIEPWEEGMETPPDAVERDGNLIVLKGVEDSDDLLPSLDELKTQLYGGAKAGLARGARRGDPVQQCIVTIEIDRSTGATENPSAGHFTNATRLAVQDALKSSHARNEISILEPVMHAVIRVPQRAAGTVQHDITAYAGGQVIQVSPVEQLENIANIDVDRIYAPPDPYHSTKTLRESGRDEGDRVAMVEMVAIVPLATTMDYYQRLKPMTGDRQSVSLSFHSWQKMFESRVKELFGEGKERRQ